MSVKTRGVQKDEELEELLDGEGSFEDEAPEPEEGEEETFDFSGTGDIKDGIYHARVQEFTRTFSQAGNPMYVAKLYMPEIGRSLDAILSLVPAAAWKTGAALRALGVVPETEGGMASFRRSDLVGRLCRVEIKNEPFEGRNVPKVANIIRPGEHGETEAAFEQLT